VSTIRIAPLRQAGAAIRLAAANLSRLRSPLKVNLCVTYRCQYRCKTCDIWRRSPQNELTTDELMSFVNANKHVAWLDVTGGEIFLRSDIEEFLVGVAASWRRLALLHFATNGFLTDKIVAATRRTAQATTAAVIVTVSLDGDETLNDHIRGIRGGFRRQIETFNRLRDIPGVRAVLGMTLSSYNVGQIEKTFRACQAECPGLDIEDFHVNVAQRSSHYYGNAETERIEAPREQTLHELRVYRRLRGRQRSASGWLEGQYLRYLDVFLRSGVSPMQCHALRSSCFIDPWGAVYPCITYARPVGQLRETGMALAPIWHGEACTATQQEIWAGKCPQCWTACEAYQTILGNLLRPASLSIRQAEM
jgi:radical SAM protein with 4Fe4S-binding SPASM domain